MGSCTTYRSGEGWHLVNHNLGTVTPFVWVVRNGEVINPDLQVLDDDSVNVRVPGGGNFSIEVSR
jgi:hypothetical protein